MILFSYLQTHPPVFLFTLAVFGAMLGSFLNVVIHRLPKMLEHAWQNECHMMFTDTISQPTNSPRYNLWMPHSQCTHCDTRLRWWQNIPMLSFLFLRGRCFYCKTSISPRYFFIEILAAVIAVVLGWYYGFNWEVLAALIFTFSLMALSAIDIQHQILPDAIVLPLLWLGLLINLSGLFCDINSAVLGAALGYGCLWSVANLFKFITGKEGMGQGDFKLLAALGAWLGWQALPFVIICASVLGLIFGIVFLCLRGQNRNTPIPFGPYLAVAGWVALLWGNEINSWYLNTIGF